MALPSQSERDMGGAESTPRAAAVREQLRRLLAHPLFTNSKRYPVLLAYTVEQTLTGHGSNLKERTIGVEAFGREPHYDVNLDPVVRTTAAEVRKRLIQYYYNPEHAGELVIELPLGAYVPSFREPVQDAGRGGGGLFLAGRAGEPGTAAAPLMKMAHEDRQVRSRTWTQWVMIAAGLAMTMAAGFGLGRIGVERLQPKQVTQLDRFWDPIRSASTRITYCLGEPMAATDHGRMTPPGVPTPGGMDVSDVITLARSIVPLVPRHDAFRVVPATETSYAQLREGPFVLIGAFDNPWTMRIMQDLPFDFEYVNQVREVVDRRSAGKRFWALAWKVPRVQLAKDYGVVARIHDKVTGQPVIILAGILGEGTQAASELASNPAYLEAMLRNAPKDWDQHNLEAVIETDVIDGHPGPPTVMAVDTW
jgi:hypothetical protein